jgi:ubiquinone/menaquinone biosynthesis C-methylase UbiE
MKNELKKEYELRFIKIQDYRIPVWKVLTSNFFQKYIPKNSVTLDIGCGWGEFINNIRGRVKYGMDLNPEGNNRLNSDVLFLNQDCSKKWNLPDDTLDIVFTSNFFEHLPSKEHIKKTILQAKRCLKSGGKIICLGPNIKYIPGKYWDFWDHNIALTEESLSEILRMNDFMIEKCFPKFLPYTMAKERQPPLLLVKFYLKIPLLWHLFGKQFLIIGKKV